MRYLDTAIRIAVWTSTIIACVSLAGMMVLISIEVVIRSLGFSLLLTDEYSGYMVLAVMGFGLAIAFERNQLLRVEIFFDRLGPRVRTWLTAIYAVTTILFCIVLTYRLAIFAWLSYTRGFFAPTPQLTPLFIPQSFAPIGLGLLCLVAIRRLFAPKADPSQRTPRDLLDGGA